MQEKSVFDYFFLVYLSSKLYLIAGRVKGSKNEYPEIKEVLERFF